MSDFHHTTDTSGGRVLVTAGGELDMHTSVAFRQVLLDLLDKGTEVVVDLGGLTFIDSSGLSAFIAAHKRAATLDGAALVLDQVPPFLDRILAVTGLASVLPVRG
ncbi:STAS domain-containing protein [Actinokineospora bangkokensis]|uniref:Anti-sigma factor antagonist n=1 Tax=Actinokineospora bangkokensis TaxID=1193682 RepID=A0A1Q9LQA3_9PSEU|nr:STAS domain-containing protein [Actinokineospora bangkokensis]OLR94181.1 hypothetical protein BJP25_10290 [Actinokineospora bangkokensis]